jgi:hypothetical protein
MMSATQPPMTKLSGAQLAEVLRRCELPEEAAAAVAGIADVPGVISALVARKSLVEAARVFAHALPKREAVWWACMCAAHTAPPAMPEPDRRARETAELWVRQQTDALRRAAMDHAKAAGFQSPEAWAGVAAFWSGDSIAPPENFKVPPPPHLTGVAVAGAVTLAAVRRRPEWQGQRLALFLQSARDIAAGGTGRLPGEEQKC